MSEYPEHDKLEAIKDESQSQGEFLDWLGSQGISLMVWGFYRTESILACWRCTHFTDKSRDACACPTCEGTHEYTEYRTIEGWRPINKPLNDLLAEYHDIDRKKLEQEKQDMMTELQELGEDATRNEDGYSGPVQRPSRTP